MTPENGADKETSVCEVCKKAEQLGGAIRCMACGRWVPRADKRKAVARSLAGDQPGALAELAECPRCPPGQQRPRATIRLPYRIFFKCDRCLSVWSHEVKRY